MEINIDGRIIGPNYKPYIIAELSANHNGSIERAIESLNTAKNCGVDAVKIQTYTSDTMTIDCDHPDFIIKGGLWDGFKLYDLYKWAETPYEWHEILFNHARKIGLTLFSTPFDESAVDLLEKLNTPAYKIASFEILDLPLIKYIAEKGKPIIMSTGMASESEIEDAVTIIRESGNKNFILLHCISSYPAPTDQSNLRQMPLLGERFDTIFGLSDHTFGTTVPVAAVAMGACLIEKHFTLSRKDKGPDSEFSLEPKEFEKLCSDTKCAWMALGKAGFQRQEAEKSSMVFRRSLYFVKDLPAGHVIEKEDIRRIRPGMGLAPKYFEQLIGKTLKQEIKMGTAVNFSFFKEGSYN